MHRLLPPPPAPPRPLPARHLFLRLKVLNCIHEEVVGQLVALGVAVV